MAKSQKFKSVEAILRERGPSLSSDISKQLLKEGCTSTTARKRIQRSKNIVFRVKHTKFPHNSQFLYLKEHYRTEQFWDSLLEAFGKTGSIYGHAIFGLEGRGGIIPVRQFGIVSGAPKRLKKQISYEKVLENLIKLELLEMRNHLELGECVSFSELTQFETNSPSRMKALFIAEQILLCGLTQWIRYNGFGSFGKVKTRYDNADNPEFSHFEWDLTVPSYILPFVQKNLHQVKPGFIVLDATLSENLEQRHIGYFIHKSLIVFGQQRTRPFLPILVAQSFSKEALQAGRNAGMVLTTPGNLLGEEIAKALRALINTLENAAAVAVKKPEVIAELFSKLSRIEGVAGNLRGALFELIVGHCVRQKEGNFIDLGVNIVTPKTGERAEIDVLRIKERQEVWVYECKGYAHSRKIEEDEVKEWLNVKVPRIHKWIRDKERFKLCKIGFELWTSGNFSQHALELLKKRQKSIRRYRIDWKDGEAIYDYVKAIKSKYFIKVLQNHYLRHPLSNHNRK